METKKGGFQFFLDSFHQTSWSFIGISTVVCGSFWDIEKFKMAAATMVTKVQKMLNSLQTGDPFETWHKNRTSLKVVLFVFKIFKMAANIKILKIVKNSKIDFNGNGYLQGVRHAAPYCNHFTKYKNPPIWEKFGFQVVYDDANRYPLFGSHVMILLIISYLVERCVSYWSLLCIVDGLSL